MPSDMWLGIVVDEIFDPNKQQPHNILEERLTALRVKFFRDEEDTNIRHDAQRW